MSMHALKIFLTWCFRPNLQTQLHTTSSSTTTNNSTLLFQAACLDPLHQPAQVAVEVLWHVPVVCSSVEGHDVLEPELRGLILDAEVWLVMGCCRWRGGEQDGAGWGRLVLELLAHVLQEPEKGVLAVRSDAAAEHACELGNDGHGSLRGAEKRLRVLLRQWGTH